MSRWRISNRETSTPALAASDASVCCFVQPCASATPGRYVADPRKRLEKGGSKNSTLNPCVSRSQSYAHFHTSSSSSLKLNVVAAARRQRLVRVRQGDLHRQSFQLRDAGHRRGASRASRRGRVLGQPPRRRRKRAYAPGGRWISATSPRSRRTVEDQRGRSSERACAAKVGGRDRVGTRDVPRVVRVPRRKHRAGGPAMCAYARQAPEAHLLRVSWEARGRGRRSGLDVSSSGVRSSRESAPKTRVRVSAGSRERARCGRQRGRARRTISTVLPASRRPRAQWRRRSRTYVADDGSMMKYVTKQTHKHVVTITQRRQRRHALARFRRRRLVARAQVRHDLFRTWRRRVRILQVRHLERPGAPLRRAP